MATNLIRVNGRDYRAKEIDFNFLCELNNNGVDITEVDSKILSAVRVYVAYCMGTSVEIAGNEMNEHVINGGGLEDFTAIFAEKTEESGFFQALNKRAKETANSNSKKNTKKKTEDVTE